MSRHRLLEGGINIATRFLTLTDALQPLTDVEVRRVVALTIYIGIEQTTLREVQLRRRGHRVRAVLSRYVGIEGRIGRDNALLDLLRIPLRILIHRDGEDVGNLHRGLMTHEHLTTVTAAGQGRTIQHGQVSVRPLEGGLQHVGHRTAILEEIDTTGRGSGVRNTHVHDLVDRIILMRQQVT